MRVVCSLLLVGMGSLSILRSVEAQLTPPVLKWGPTVVGTGTGSAYYLNDSVVDGSVLGARISYGPYEQNRSGTVVNALPTGATKTGKSAVRVGDFVYFTGDNGGVWRTQVANTATPWSTFSAVTVSNGAALETLATDGTRIFASTTVQGEQVHAYLVDPGSGAMGLLWSTVGIAGRVRGLDWDRSGYIYATDGGGPSENAAGNTSHLYAIAASDGTAVDLGSVTHNGRTYQVLREKDQLALFDSFTGTGAPAGQMYVFDLANDTNLLSTTPSATWDPAGIGRIFGAAIDDDGSMWLTSGGGQTYLYAVPEPSTWAALAGGALSLLALSLLRRRKKSRQRRRRHAT